MKSDGLEKKRSGLAEGDLYYNDSGIDLEAFISVCIEKHKEKSKAKPTLVLVHESDWKSINSLIPMYATINIQPGHVLVGRLVEEVR